MSVCKHELGVQLPTPAIPTLPHKWSTARRRSLPPRPATFSRLHERSCSVVLVVDSNRQVYCGNGDVQSCTGRCGLCSEGWESTRTRSCVQTSVDSVHSLIVTSTYWPTFNQQRSWLMTTSGAIPSTEPFRSAASKTILNIMSVQPLYLSRSPPSLAFSILLLSFIFIVFLLFSVFVCVWLDCSA